MTTSPKVGDFLTVQQARGAVAVVGKAQQMDPDSTTGAKYAIPAPPNGMDRYGTSATRAR